MKLTLVYSNVGNFRGDTTMDPWKYARHALRINPDKNFAHLEELVKLVHDEGADVIGMGEIDQCCHWSGRVNQPQYLANMLDFGVVYGRNYQSPLPFVYSVDTGNAILSRFPINNKSGLRRFKRRTLFEMVTSFVGNKEFVHVIHYLPNGRRLHTVCTHLSTNSRVWRANSALDLVDYFKERIISSGDPYILMGDFNTVPLYTQKKSGFNDDAHLRFKDDYHEDYTLYFLGLSGLFKSTMKRDPFNFFEIDDQELRYGTYPQKPNRMIDYIFVSPDFTTTDVVTIPIKFSDHRVIKTEVFLPD